MQIKTAILQIVLLNLFNIIIYTAVNNSKILSVCTVYQFCINSISVLEQLYSVFNTSLSSSEYNKKALTKREQKKLSKDKELET